MKSLDKFKDVSRRFHSAYYLANLGLANLTKNGFSQEASRTSAVYILRDEQSDQVISEYPRSYLLAGMKEDGPISQVIAHGILSWIYTAWNDKYRKEIALELGVDANDVLCDVMGDLRLVRNAIAHDFATAGNKVANLRELSWFKPGRLILTTNDMNKIQLKINAMTVYIRGEQ